MLWKSVRVFRKLATLSPYVRKVSERVLRKLATVSPYVRKVSAYFLSQNLETCFDFRAMGLTLYNSPTLEHQVQA